jgi:hypothetical protein
MLRNLASVAWARRCDARAVPPFHAAVLMTTVQSRFLASRARNCRRRVIVTVESRCLRHRAHVRLTAPTTTAENPSPSSAGPSVASVIAVRRAATGRLRQLPRQHPRLRRHALRRRNSCQALPPKTTAAYPSVDCLKILPWLTKLSVPLRYGILYTEQIRNCTMMAD